MIKKAYKFRFYPTKEQVTILDKTFGCVRFVYNTMLRYRTDEWFDNKVRINYSQTSKRLTELKKMPEFSWLNEISCVPTQQCLRNLQTAFTNFFEKRAKYPTFKNKRGKQSAEYTRSAFKYCAKTKRLWIAKCKEPLKIKWSRQISNNPSTVTVSKDCFNRYFVSIRFEEETKPLPKSDNQVGIDLGINRLAALSNGINIGNPVYTAKYKAKLNRAQRKLSRKKKGSNNWNKQKLKVAKIHSKITDSRKDYMHKATTNIVRENQTICIEDLSISSMLKSKKAGKHTMNRCIADSSMFEFRRQLEYKSEWYGRDIIVIDRYFPSSKRCSSCGFTVHSLPLNVRNWRCPECSAEHDRDFNASLNILAAGLAVSVCGTGVRPARTSVRSRQSVLKQKALI